MNKHGNNKVTEISSTQFQFEVEEFQGSVLIDFYAPWCGPCKMLSPVIEQIAAEKSELKVVKINADENQTLISKFGIRGIPTLLLINDGKLVDTQVGAASLSQTKRFVEQNLSS